MEFRKIYIRRLLPVLAIILALVLVLIGHEALKAQAQVADTKEELRQIQNNKEKVNSEELKRELSKEVEAAVLELFNERMETINLSEYFSDEDWNLLYERIETSLIERELFDMEKDSFSEEQKEMIDSLIKEAISLYSQMNMNAALNDVAKTEVAALIDDAISRAIDDMYDKVDADLSNVKNELVMTEEEKNALVKEISQDVQHDLLAYITEHIQLIYDGEGGGDDSSYKKLVCEKEEHVHTSDCYTRELICELEEDENHTHGDECYEYETVCEKEEHVHNDDCYENVESDDETSGASTTPCVHVHVDYLLTDEDRAKIVADILDGTDLAGVLSSVFYQEIEKTMSDIVKDKMYEAIHESLSDKLDEMIEKSLGEIQDRLSEAEGTILELQEGVKELSGQLVGIERGSQTIRYNDVTGMIECFTGGEWKSFMSASSIWVSKGLIYSSGKKSENFDGLKGFAIASSSISYSETGNALQFYSMVHHDSAGQQAENVYTTDQSKPFEYTSEYNTLRIDYGMVGTSGYVVSHATGKTTKHYYYHDPSLTVQVIDYTTKDVFSSKTASTIGSGFVQGTMDLPLPDNPYYLKVSYKFNSHGTSKEDVQGQPTSAYAYIYSIQCIKK